MMLVRRVRRASFFCIVPQLATGSPSRLMIRSEVRRPARPAGESGSMTPTSGGKGDCVMPMSPCVVANPSRVRTVCWSGRT